MLFYTSFIYDLLPCNHTKIYIIFLDINLLKYRTPCSATERQRALGKNSKLPVYESYNKLFHRILSTCLKLHIPANLQTCATQPKHSLITLKHFTLTLCWSELKFWKIKLEKSILTNWIFAGYTGSKNPVRNSLKIHFIELDFSKLFFQKSSTDSMSTNKIASKPNKNL